MNAYVHVKMIKSISNICPYLSSYSPTAMTAVAKIQDSPFKPSVGDAIEPNEDANNNMDLESASGKT